MAKKTSTSSNALPGSTATPRRTTTKNPVEAAAPHRTAKRAGKVVEAESKVTVPSKPDADTTPHSITITHDEISKLAFTYFEQRGYQGGSPDEDWLRAEQELLAAR